MAGAARLLQTIRLRDTTQPFDRLVRFNWPGQFVVTFAGMVASLLIAGLWYPYWRVADIAALPGAMVLLFYLPHKARHHLAPTS
jgi:hypothetical protein